MSFDLYFLRRPENGSWDDAVAALAALAKAEPPVTSADQERWSQVERRLSDVVPGLDGYDGDRFRELTDEATGLQVFFSPGEITLSVPFWYEGEDADRVMDLLRRVARAIEEETGLTAYDPQGDRAFLAREGEPARVLDQISRKTRQLGSEPTSPAPPPQRSWFQRLFGRDQP
jgi:hypothetical protein